MNATELERVFDDIYTTVKGRAREVTFNRPGLVEYIDERNGLAGPPRTTYEVSQALWAYRGKRDRKYAVSCEGYGKAALWKVCAVEGRPAINRRRTTDRHGKYVAEDAVRRELSDLKYEVFPALKVNGAPRAEMDYRISAFEVHGVQRLQDAGVTQNEAIIAMAEMAAELREVI